MSPYYLIKRFVLILGSFSLCTFDSLVSANTDDLLRVPDPHTTNEQGPPFQFFLDKGTLAYKTLSSKEIVVSFSLKVIPNANRKDLDAYSVAGFEYNCTKKEGRNLFFEMYDEQDRLTERVEMDTEVDLLDSGGESLENNVFHMVCDSKIKSVN